MSKQSKNETRVSGNVTTETDEAVRIERQRKLRPENYHELSRDEKLRIDRELDLIDEDGIPYL